MHYQLVMLPYPVTALALLGVYLHQALGLFSRGAVFCRCHRSAARPPRAINDDCALWLSGPDLAARLAALIRLMPAEKRQLLRAYLGYFGRSPHKYTTDLRQLVWLFSQLSLDPATVADRAVSLCKRLLDCRWRPNDGPLPLDDLIFDQVKVPVLHPSSVHHTLPVFRSNLPLDHEIVSYRQVSLDESRAAELVGQHIGLVVGGPPRSGKSTLVASLHNELTNIVASLKTRPGWEDFSFEIKCLNLDLGTPTVHAITQSSGRDDNKLKRIKQPWSKELALEAMRSFCKEKAKANLVIGDLPGKIDLFTELISAPADAGIIVCHDWSKKPEWQAFYGSLGIVKVAQARTRTAEEGLPSMVKRFNPSHELAGRIAGLDRHVCSWDPFITFLARALLFDLLPSLIARRKKELDRFLP